MADAGDFDGQYGRAVQARVYGDGVFGHRPAVPSSPEGLEVAAERAMSRAAFAYVAGSAGAERTAAANRAAFDRWQLVPRMLAGAERRELGITLFGHRYPSPLLLCPIGVLELARSDGDRETARAAAARGVPMIISTQASASTEDIVATMGAAPRWYQLYWSRVPEIAASMVQRAERSGCQAIVVTLDTHTLGWRPRDLDLGYLPFARGLGIAQYTSDPEFMKLVRQRTGSSGSASSASSASSAPSVPARRPTPAAVRSLLSIAAHHPGSTRDNLRSPVPRAAVETFLDVFPNPALTWSDLPFLREHTGLPILLKGILSADDARRALDAGVDGIVVSNHGGRQVDGAVAALDALPAVVEAVAGRVPVVLDSGVRTGADVVKALALGASAVGIGRPYVYGLALDGQAGVEAVLDHVLAELDLTMGLVGVRSIAEIDRTLLTQSG